MAKTETTTTKNMNKPARTMKKVSATQIRLSEQKVGFELEGKFIGMTVREQADGEGEIKKLHTMIIENATGERIKCLADAGLRTALEDAMVQSGDWFKAVKGEKMNIGGGRTMNQWDIFQFAEEN